MNAGWNSIIQTEFDIDGNEMLIVDGNADDDEKELVLVQTSVSSNRLPPPWPYHVTNGLDLTPNLDHDENGDDDEHDEHEDFGE